MDLLRSCWIRWGATSAPGMAAERATRMKIHEVSATALAAKPHVVVMVLVNSSFGQILLVSHSVCASGRLS